MLPRSHCSLLVRTDFSSDESWRAVCDEALREYEDGVLVYHLAEWFLCQG